VSYLLQTPDQQTAMLAKIGVPSMQTLLDQIPRDLQVPGLLNLPPACGELELEQQLRSLAARSDGVSHRTCFMGGGAYDHYIPSAVDELTGRGEFYTAYTPYQAEASQGTLQAFYEFQTLICQLTGMDVANASLYEGSTAVTEAVFMAGRVTGREKRVVVLGTLRPDYRQVLQTYADAVGLEVVVIPTTNGTVALDHLEAAVNAETACVVIQQPNAFGLLEDVTAACEIAHRHGGLAVVSCDPLSLGILKRPGDCGADIVVAEGQSLGIPLQFGGPYLGIMACRQEFVRKMPGRLIGLTKDRTGKPCYVLNLQTREQHIRRDKATSNICTNQGLMALRAAVYLSLMGPSGMSELGQLCCQRAHYLAEQLEAKTSARLAFSTGFFKEFVITHPAGGAALQQRALKAGFDIGPTLADFGETPGISPELQSEGVLIAVTESRTRAQMDQLVTALSGS